LHSSPIKALSFGLLEDVRRIELAPTEESTMRVHIIGGGIMGLSTALVLNQSGHRVTLFEQGPIPNPAGSSVDDHRLIRHPYGSMAGYGRLVNAAFDAWEHTWTALGRRFYHATGTIILAREDTGWAEASLAEMDLLGIENRRLDARALQALAPMLRTNGDTLAAHVESGGVLFADKIVSALATHLLMQGVVIHTNTPVVDIDPVRGTLVTGDGQQSRADIIVVAAGPWVRALRPETRVKASRQVVIHLEGLQAEQRAWASAPMVLDIHAEGGIYVVPPVAGTPLKVGDHSFSLKGYPDDDREPKKSEIDAIFEACRSRFVDLDNYTVTGAKTCFYTVQRDECFVLERQDKMVMMSGFSGHGFKFGALMGRLAAGVTTNRADAGVIRDLAAGRITDITEIERVVQLCY
jgi:glycine/D-amino acid oxidase-like deaminating enzyme